MAASAAGAEQGVLTHSKWVYHSCLISVQLIAAPKLHRLECSKCFPFVLIISALNFSRGNLIMLHNVAFNFTSPSSHCDQLCGAHCTHITQQTAQGWGRNPSTPGEMDAYAQTVIHPQYGHFILNYGLNRVIAARDVLLSSSVCVHPPPCYVLRCSCISCPLLSALPLPSTVILSTQ